MAKKTSPKPQPAKGADAPTIMAREVSMWGEFTEEELQNPNRDQFYLPGYSDKREAWELAMRDWEQGGRHGPPPRPLDRRFQYVSVQRANSAPDGRKQADYASRGYTPVKWDLAESYGLQLVDDDGNYTTAARPGPDGNVYVGSQLLMTMDAGRVAREAAALLERQDAQLDRIDARLQDAAASFNQKLRLSGTGGTAFEFVEEPPDADV